MAAMNWLLCVCVLCFLCALGEGQDSNLTLFKIVPCGEVRVDSVSRFKSDIYAVEANLSQCLNVSGALLHDKIGFRVVSWANVSTVNYEDNQQAPVVFIGRQGNSGVVSWNIPLQPQGFTSYFHHINRTMCPSNVTAQQALAEDDMAVIQENPEFLFYIDVFSSSESPVTYSIAVETVPQFILELDQPLTITVGAASPQIHYFVFPEDVSTVTVEAYTDSNRCAFVSVQNNTCPINDLLENAVSRGLYQTMSKSAFLTVGVKQVLNREFVLVLITANFTVCHTSGVKLEDLFPPNTTTNSENFEFAQNITITVRKLEPTSKFVLAIFFPFLVFVGYLAIVCLYIFALPRVYLHFERGGEKRYQCCSFHWTWKFPWSNKCTPAFISGSVQNYNSIEDSSGLSIQSPVADGSKDSDSTTTATTTSTPIEESLKSIHCPDESKLMLPLMCTQRYSKLEKQYSIYSWNTITVGIFYALPAFQLVLSEQQILNTSGNQDKCYFNFECSHPLGVLSAFNSVWSNVGYFLLGFLFIVLVSARKYIYKKHRNLHRAYVDSHGVPEFYGVYQAMGIALILEGFMSAFYHICPTDANFQFDTAFMFIIGGLFIVKLFQSRHPDINANAFIAFFSFAVIIFITLVGIYIDRKNPVAIRITLFVFVIIILLLFFVSFYRFHSWKWESIKEDFRNCKLQCPQHRCRFLKLVLVFLANLVLLLVVVIMYNKIDIATSLLGFFVMNLLLFLVIYVAQKLFFMETFTLLSLFLAAVSVAMWACAFYFFILKASTNWQLTPAESRAMNHPCTLLGFYDSHDVWHFFSASAMFFSFLFLLILDDGLRNTKREDIHIF